jgi:hypothetical protein
MPSPSLSLQPIPLRPSCIGPVAVQPASRHARRLAAPPHEPRAHIRGLGLVVGPICMSIHATVRAWIDAQ